MDIIVLICKCEILTKRDLNPNFVSGGKNEGPGSAGGDRRPDRRDERPDRRGGDRRPAGSGGRGPGGPGAGGRRN